MCGGGAEAEAEAGAGAVGQTLLSTLFCICAAHLHLEYKRYIFVRPF